MIHHEQTAINTYEEFQIPEYDDSTIKNKDDGKRIISGLRSLLIKLKESAVQKEKQHNNLKEKYNEMKIVNDQLIKENEEQKQ
jgi:hypothetical protein